MFTGKRIEHSGGERAVGGVSSAPVLTPLPILKGRGTPLNPQNRFERLHVEVDGDALDADRRDGVPDPGPETQYFNDTSKSIIATNDSPDVGFTHSVNPYRGCSHGCIYCYARPGHEYLGFSSGLDFESKIMVKLDAAELLHKELSRPGWKPTTLNFSGVTDCYQPAERRFGLTRACISVCREFGNPVSIVTKNALVARDIDILSDMASRRQVLVIVSVTSLDADLARVMEPRAAAPRVRLETIRSLSAAKIPVGVMVAPVVPGLTDQEIPGILRAAADSGATFCAYVPLRLPYQIKDLFEDWLARRFPDRREKVLNRIRSLRGGKLNESDFFKRMRGEGPWAAQLKAMFDLAKRRTGLDGPGPELTTQHFRVPAGPQMSLW